MKLVILMYLSDDDESVQGMLRREGIDSYSRIPLEGHGSGAAGWYGLVAPYSSAMIVSMLPDDRADSLVRTIAACDECEDPEHPVHAIVIDIERAVVSGSLDASTSQPEIDT